MLARTLGSVVLTVALAGYVGVGGFAILVVGAVVLDGTTDQASALVPAYATLVAAVVVAVLGAALWCVWGSALPRVAAIARWAFPVAPLVASVLVLAGALAVAGSAYGRASSDYCLDNVPADHTREGGRIGGATFESPVRVRCVYDGRAYVRTHVSPVTQSVLVTGVATGLVLVLWKRAPRPAGQAQAR